MPKEGIIGFIVVIVLGVGVLLGLSYIGESPSKGGGGESDTIPNTKDCYSEVTALIEKYKTDATWSGNQYRLMRKLITDYHDQKCLDSVAVGELTSLLDVEHLILFSDTATTFCKVGQDLKALKSLYDDAILLAKTQGDFKVKTYIEKYYNLFSLEQKIKHYTFRREFVPNLTSTHKEAVTEYEQITYLSDNKYVQGRIENLLKLLFRQQNIHNEYIAKRDFSTPTWWRECDCEQKFKGSKYYVDECLALKDEFSTNQTP